MKQLRWMVLGFLALCSCGKPAVDWSTKEAKPSEQKIGDIAFTINLPDGLKPDSLLTAENSLAWESVDGMFSGPRISVALLAIYPESLEDAVKEVGEQGTITRKEAIDGGFIVTSQNANKTMVDVTTWTMATEDKAFKCNAMLRPMPERLTVYFSEESAHCAKRRLSC